MGDSSQTEKPNPKPKSNATNQRWGDAKKRNQTTKRKEDREFEFCKVCRLNHDQGQRHKYFPNHMKSLSAFLARFQTKTEDIRFFLKNPSALRPEHATRNRFWCVFCDDDIDELGSSFACCNAINHLASEDHLKNLKHFLWKNGGGMDRVDALRILEADVAKWEKKCQSLESEAASSLYGLSNDIHNEISIKNKNNFENNTIHPLKSNHSHGVMPLQYYTGENQISYSGLYEVTNVRSDPGVSFSLPYDLSSGTSLWNSSDLTVKMINQQSRLCSSTVCSGSAYHINGQVSYDERTAKGNGAFTVLQRVTRVSSLSSEEVGGNVHSGAPPPWFEATDENLLNGQLKPVSGSFASSTNKSGKSNKLNPKRVGAAWAEKRKMELEREKRGEFVNSDFDANWLPNFGRVWQSGSRKESRKEFENEKKKLLKVESNSEMPTKLQPYISKRMQRDGVGADSSGHHQQFSGSSSNKHAKN